MHGVSGPPVCYSLVFIGMESGGHVWSLWVSCILFLSVYICMESWGLYMYRVRRPLNIIAGGDPRTQHLHSIQ